MTTDPIHVVPMTPDDPPTILIRSAVQYAIALRGSLADFGAMNLRYDWPTGERAIGKRPSYGRVDYDLNREACDDTLDSINAPRDVTTRRAIIDVWNALAFGYDEGYAHGAGENDEPQEADLMQWSVFARSSGEPISDDPVFTHVPVPVDNGPDEPHCGVCGETPGDDWQHITDNDAVYLVR